MVIKLNDVAKIELLLSDGSRVTKDYQAGEHDLGPIHEFNIMEGPNSLTSVISWGKAKFTSCHAMFNMCENLVSLPEEAPDLSQVDNMNMMFYGAKKFNQPIGHWDVSTIKVARYMFALAYQFNQQLPWNTLSLTDIQGMFLKATSFDQELDWDLSALQSYKVVFRESKNGRFKNQPTTPSL